MAKLAPRRTEYGPFVNIGEIIMDTGARRDYGVDMARKRPRKRHVQLSFKKVDKNGQGRIGKNAGRKPKGKRAGERHKTRSEVDSRQPQHAVLRVGSDVKWLRTEKAYRAVRRALVTVLDRGAEFRIVQISVQGNHIHLLCEASDKVALGKGMQAFAISAAKHLNRVHRRSGTVFPDHYHVEAIDSVRQACHALSYVLNNWRKHKQDGRGLLDGRIDPFSSGVLFDGWKERTQSVTVPEGYEAPRVSAARTWYLTSGYKLGPPISVWAVPSAKKIGAA
jgi:REP element-mobilizing transposase RayT